MDKEEKLKKLGRYGFAEGKEIMLALGGEGWVQADFNSGFSVNGNSFPQCTHVSQPLFTAVKMGNGDVIVVKQDSNADDRGKSHMDSLYGYCIVSRTFHADHYGGQVNITTEEGDTSYPWMVRGIPTLDRATGIQTDLAPRKRQG